MSKWWSFGGGFLLGSIGLTALSSKLAQRSYKYVVAGGMLARDRIMEESEKVQAAVSNITAEAKELTEKYYAKMDEENAALTDEAE